MTAGDWRDGSLIERDRVASDGGPLWWSATLLLGLLVVSQILL